ncbi:hypothetical protein [Helicobacter sp. 11S03491-1]|uniref:hypothetical protein n=1 Tax=Helicobacter sp. 11S03491-1 TaxID=1476196 RepID=UPI000BA76585|nr:hypothetical protein [Helicobacter sp. 11S03491-1]PAF42300.1 hypothetical protein BKH45_04995 [Helicobacter sp. 11S03491-1]
MESIDNKDKESQLIENKKKIDIVIQKCNKVLETRNLKEAQELKTEILFTYETFFQKAFQRTLGRDLLCEYDVFGDYNPQVLNMNRSYVFNINKMFENIILLRKKLLLLQEYWKSKK